MAPVRIKLLTRAVLVTRRHMALVELIILMAGVQKYSVMSSGLSPELLHSVVCQHVVVHLFQLIIQRNGGTFPVWTKTRQPNR